MKLIITSSLSYQIYLVLERYFKNSLLYRIPFTFVDYVIFLYKNSFVNHYFHTKHSFFAPLFSGGIFYNLVNQIFFLLSLVLSILTKLWRGTWSARICKHFQEDLAVNYIGYVSTFLFTSLLIYSFLNLLFGRGYSRSQMLVLLSIIFLLFGLSQIKERSSEYFRNSVIIQWIKKIYL
jgi:hypothetical protein